MLHFHSLLHITLRNYFNLYYSISCCLQVTHSVFSMLSSRIFIIKKFIPHPYASFLDFNSPWKSGTSSRFHQFCKYLLSVFSKFVCFVLTLERASGFLSSSNIYGDDAISLIAFLIFSFNIMFPLSMDVSIWY